MRALKIFFALIVVLIAAVIALPFVVPTDVIADQVAKITKQQTGRDLNLGGDISFSVYPNIAVSMDDVSISNPQDMPTGVLLAANQLRLSLALMPLLQGDIQVKTFELVEPRFNLLTDSQGRTNWSVESGDDNDGRGDREDAAGGGTTVRSITLEDVRIVDGIVRYLDETTGAAFEAQEVNVSVSLQSMDANLSVDGSLLWQGETVALTTALGPVSQFTADKTADVDLELTSPHLNAQFRGALSLAAGLALDGNVDATSASLRDLANWAGSPLAAGAGLQDFSATAALRLTADEISLTDAQVGLDGMRAQGNVSVATGGARPRITASLGVNQIDLNRYLGGGGGGSSGGSGGGWSDAPIDFSGLKAVDAQLRLAASQILYQNVSTGNAVANITIENGRLDAQIEQLSLYGGTATGFMQLDGNAAAATVVAGLDADQISAHPFLVDFADFDWIEGASQMSMRLNSVGNSQRALVSSLSGNAQLLFTDGAIRGINIAAMMRNLGSSILSGWERSESQKTDFASLSATYQISQGIAVNNDLSMIGPLVRLTGAGTVDMPNQYLNYKVDPKLVGSLEGQGGATDLTGFNVPIIIKGPWGNPDIYPDIAGILDNPAEALRQLEMIGDLDAGAIEETVSDVLGDDGVGQVEDVIDDVLGEDGEAQINDFLQGLTGGSNN